MSKEWKKMKDDDKMKYMLLAEADRKRFLREHAVYENNKSVEKSTKYGTGRKKGSYCYRKNELKPEYQKQIEEMKKQKEKEEKEKEINNSENKENENKDNSNLKDENNEKPENTNEVTKQTAKLDDKIIYNKDDDENGDDEYESGEEEEMDIKDNAEENKKIVDVKD